MFSCLLQGTPEKLLQGLIDENNSLADPTYMEDFLLTFRTFLKSSLDVTNRLVSWFNEPALREKVSAYFSVYYIT